jgi:isochorismate synthase
MEFSESLGYSLFDHLVDSDVRFAVYRLPGNKELNFVMQKSSMPETFNDLTELNSKKGFVIAPFHISKFSPIVIIRPDIVLNGETDIFQYLSSLSFSSIKKENVDLLGEGCNVFDKYEKVYKKFHGALTDNTFQKLVLSRTKDISREPTFSAGNTFKSACDKYPDNFIFLCNTPESGTWFGCSPEVLLEKQADCWSTVALAGTQEYSENTQNVVWDSKNRLEQQIVVEYMQNQLSKADIESTHNDPLTIKSGNVVHLKSEFKFQIGDLSKLGDLLKLLHPSPAVCGFPKQEAFDFIVGSERYNRQYYSGFVGFMDANQQTNLYVNLRCMNISGDKLRLFAGGGILASSDVQSEWMETEHKLQTILSVIQKIN